VINLEHLLSKRERSAVDHAMMVAAVVHPLTALPQVVQIYTTHTAAGVSLATWLGFMVLGTIFLAYALIHRIRPMIVTQVLWFFVDLSVVTGVLLYG
jgi:uncharacterized protein with PQ loop repeat